MNKNSIIVFDFETGGLDTKTTEPIEIAAIALDPRSLDPISKYYSLCKPTDFSIVSPDALRVNGKTIPQLEVAPEQSVVWKSFVEWIKTYSKGTKFTNPIPCGKNIRNFDLPIFDRLCIKYGYVDKDGKPNVWHPTKTWDVQDFLDYWFENNNDLVAHSMDACREFFGMSKDGAHSAMIDTVQTAHMLIKFLTLHRNAYKTVNPKTGGFRNTMSVLPDKLKALLEENK